MRGSIVLPESLTLLLQSPVVVQEFRSVAVINRHSRTGKQDVCSVRNNTISSIGKFHRNNCNRNLLRGEKALPVHFFRD